MRDTDLYGQILGVARPWQVSSVDLRVVEGSVEVYVEHKHPESLCCPECGASGKRHSTRKRSWRHLPTCQFKTVLTAEVPRVRCPEHGVKTVPVPWADPRSGFTALFEFLIIGWLGEASISAVARQLDLTWDQVDGVMHRAVRRGLERRQPAPARELGVDETSFQKRHEYVTVVADLAAGGCVRYVADGRGNDALGAYYQGLDPSALSAIETVTMDMWPPYIAMTSRFVPEGRSKIAFDKFHVAMHLGKAVDQVRRAEHRDLQRQGDDSLKGTLHLWRTNPERHSEKQSLKLAAVSRKAKRTARAWELKELGMEMWNCTTREDAEDFFHAWYQRAIRSKLQPVRKVAKTLKSHLFGILTAIVKKITNARLEGINTTIQWIKRSARGFRNRDRFRAAIYFHLGGLQLRPYAMDHLSS